MSYTLSVVVRDAVLFDIIDARFILQHPNRLFLESLLEVNNGFIKRIEQTERSRHSQKVFVVFQVKPVTVNNRV